MKYFDFTLPTPAENLACDEALLNLCEEGLEGEILRFWEPNEPFVVVGYANQVAREVQLEICKARGIPVLRRCSGGGTVVQGAGCLNYSLILKIPAPETSAQPLPGNASPSLSPGERAGVRAGVSEGHPFSSITGTNIFILDRHRAALEALPTSPVQIQGHTDLAVNNLKFSGNAQRRLRKSLLFHGTFLLNFNLGLIEQLLPMPSKQPDYRQNRPHAEFLTNLDLSANDVKTALRQIWNAQETLAEIPTAKIRDLVFTKYSTPAWNFKF